MVVNLSTSVDPKTAVWVPRPTVLSPTPPEGGGKARSQDRCNLCLCLSWEEREALESQHNNPLSRLAVMHHIDT